MQDDIQKGLDKVCSLFPGTIASQCRQLVAQYSPEIVQLLLQQLNPSDICLILDLCTKAGNVQSKSYLSLGIIIIIVIIIVIIIAIIITLIFCLNFLPCENMWHALYMGVKELNIFK